MKNDITWANVFNSVGLIAVYTLVTIYPSCSNLLNPRFNDTISLFVTSCLDICRNPLKNYER